MIISASSIFFVFFSRDFWGGQKAKAKRAFGTMKFESAASDLPPEGPKKKSCVVFRDFGEVKIWFDKSLRRRDLLGRRTGVQTFQFVSVFFSFVISGEVKKGSQN